MQYLVLVLMNVQILDCLRGLQYDIELGWHNPKTFKAKEYEEYEKVDNGDMNWIIFWKILGISFF